MSFKPSTRLRWFDLPLGLLLGFAWTILCCGGSPFHTDANGIFYADDEYCNGVSTKNLLGIGASNKRSAFSMLLPRHFARTSVFDGLASVLYGVKLESERYCTGGTLIGGRRMGTSVLLLACVAAPLTFISRVLSSYPAMSLCFVAGATGTMWGIKSNRSLPMFIAGIGVGMTLLADTRGLYGLLPWLCGLLFVILFRDHTE